MKTIKGYKVFNPNFTCRGFQYKENATFTFDGEISMCKTGFHFCENPVDLFNYYDFNPKNIVCKVKSIGNYIRHSCDTKVVTDKLVVGKKLSWNKLLDIANKGDFNTGFGNTGDYNTGHKNAGHKNTGDFNLGSQNAGFINSGNWNVGNYNIGDYNSGMRNAGKRNCGNMNTGGWNTGDFNIGYSNTGHHNSGNLNTGNWNAGNSNTGHSNTGDYNVGSFCTENNPYIKLFDKPTKIKIKDWKQSEAIRLMVDHLKNVEWINANKMSDEEKRLHPGYETVNGYLKIINLQKAWSNMWNEITEDEKKVFLDLPNFNAEKFKIITGIDVNKNEVKDNE